MIDWNESLGLTLSQPWCLPAEPFPGDLQLHLGSIPVRIFFQLIHYYQGKLMNALPRHHEPQGENFVMRVAWQHWAGPGRLPMGAAPTLGTKTRHSCVFVPICGLLPSAQPFLASLCSRPKGTCGFLLAGSTSLSRGKDHMGPAGLGGLSGRTLAQA